MKALLVGAGGMGQAWASNIDACLGAELAAWVDVRPSAAKQAAEKLQLPNVYCGVSFEDAAERVAPDFVVDVTSPESHHLITTWALRAGLPVLGEKPMAPTMTHAREMVRASEQSGKLYMVSQSRRYDPGLVALKEAIKKLGTLGILNVDFYIGAHFGGFRDNMESPLLLDMAIHTFDQGRFLSGTDPVTVIADEFNPAWSWYQGNASASAIFEMTGGLRFTYRGSWCAEGHPTSWDGDWRAVGHQGSALWAGNGVVRTDIPSGEGFIKNSVESIVDQPEISSGIAGSLEEFLNALSTGQNPQGECHDNIKSLAMIFAAKEASATGTRIRVAW